MEGGGGEGPSAMAESGKNEEDDEAVDQLPPGFRFHPTDEEIIMHYLILKVMDKRFSAIAIAEADFNKCEPWDLPKKAKTGEKEWFFFCQRDRKYPTGMRTNRATETGYWKATGKDREIYKGSRKCVVGMKKTLVFYKGRAPKGEKSSWVMHEYRLEGNFSTYTFTRAAKDSWVVCKVFDKSNGIRRDPGVELARVDTFTDHLLDIPTLPLQSQVQHDQNKFFVSHNNSYQPGPRVNDPNPIFFPQNTPHPGGFFPYRGFGSQYQPGIDPMLNYSTSFPFKGGDQASLRLMQERTCKIENFSWNSMVSHSQDTGMSNEMANEITSTHPEVGDDQSKKPYDQELEGLAFSPNMSDLDSLWSY